IDPMFIIVGIFFVIALFVGVFWIVVLWWMREEKLAMFHVCFGFVTYYSRDIRMSDDILYEIFKNRFSLAVYNRRYRAYVGS
ncbi:hypothetical protein ACJX0J_015687, partial [Zea mays]